MNDKEIIYQMAVCVNIQMKRYVYYITRTSYILYHLTHTHTYAHKYKKEKKIKITKKMKTRRYKTKK